jgi:hypothetical protein
MAVPKAAVHEDRFLSTREDKIRVSLEFFVVQAITVTHAKHQTPYN